MKTRLLLLSLLAVFTLSGFVAPLNTREEILIKALDAGIPRPRFVAEVLPVKVYIENSILTVNFSQAFNPATVSIVCLDSGDVVYSESLVNPTSITIDLTGEDKGEYEISFTLGTRSLYGSFYLE